MPTEGFNLGAYLTRIGLPASPEPTLDALRQIVAAHAATIPFENVDVLLGRIPKLDIASIQAKLVHAHRGGYCFEQNALLRAALNALGFAATGLLARVVRGSAADAAGPATHMAVRVDLPEGPFLADVGFGNMTPTSPLVLVPTIEQDTPHGTMRLLPIGAELALQVKSGDDWESLWRLCAQPVFDIDYEVGSWFTATHPRSPFVGNMIVARPGPDGARFTFLNGRFSVRRPGAEMVRSVLSDGAIGETLATKFGLDLSAADLVGCLAAIERAGQRGAAHPAFA